MDSLSGQPFWFYKNGVLEAYPALTENIREDIVIKGGGIAGAVLAWHLTQADFPVVVIKKGISVWAALPVQRLCFNTKLIQCQPI